MLIKPSLKIAIAGANGQLGFQLVKKLTGKVQLAAYDRDSLDISDPAKVEQVLSYFAPDIIINAAAYTAVDKAEQEGVLTDAINHKGAENLARTAKSLGAVLIHVSTDYVFDGKSSIPYVEDDLTNPQSVYGKSKLDGEQAIKLHCNRYFILRTAWVFCEHGNNFVKTMLRLAQSRTELGVVADQKGGPTYAGDIADAIISMVSQIHSTDEQRWGVYHYSGAPYVSWYEFANAVFTEAYRQKLIVSIPTVNAITTAQYPTPAKRPAFSMLDCTKIKRHFGIEPSDWHKALKHLNLYK